MQCKRLDDCRTELQKVVVVLGVDRSDSTLNFATLTSRIESLKHEQTTMMMPSVLVMKVPDLVKPKACAAGTLERDVVLFEI